jgi:predicted RND superfamily exporter protein
VTLSSPHADTIASLPPEILADLRRVAGPFVEFSYEKIATDLQSQIVRDSRTAFLLTIGAVVLIVSLLFRSIRAGALVLLPIAYGTLVTVGVLVLVGHQFSGMAFAAFPLIVSIGIDNSIHLVRRHLESPAADAQSLLTVSGAALVQTNLTTIVGFGALMSAGFPPLVELGVVTSVGMAFTLLASIFLIPAVLALRQPSA